MKILDENGAVRSDLPVARASWGDPWECAGVVELDDAFASWSGKDFELCACGVMRHMACLLAGGYGDSAGDIVGWFEDICALEWITDGALYRVVEDRGMFSGMIGAAFEARWSGDAPVLLGPVGVSNVEIYLEDVQDQRDLISSAIVDPPC